MPRLISEDPGETVRNLSTHPHLFSAAVLSYVVSAVGDVVMAWALYVLLQLANALNPSCASSAACLAVAGEVFNRPDDLFGQFCFVVDGFLFAYLLLAGRLIPRWMAWTGVITIGLQLVCVPLYVATLLPGRVVNWLWFPILFYEVPLGIWLIRKGGRATA